HTQPLHSFPTRRSSDLTVLGHTDDEAVKFFADPVLHEPDLFPFHQLPFSFVSAALGVTGLLGNLVQNWFGNGLDESSDAERRAEDRKSTRLNSSHRTIS